MKLKKKNVIEITNPKGFFNKGAYTEYVEGIGGGRGERRRVLQIFLKKLRSPGDHRPKYSNKVSKKSLKFFAISKFFENIKLKFQENSSSALQ